MSLAIINSTFPEKAIKMLSLDGHEIIALPPSKALPHPMSTHPDMLLFCGFGAIVCHKDYYEENRTLIDIIVNKSENRLILSDEKIEEEYPRDAIFNAAVVGNNLLCNTRFISRYILELANINGINIIHVNQGYTKCSTLIVGENNIITADRGIHSAAQKAGINSLLIGAGNVSLDPYEYGFIGGATGMLENKVFFCGDLEEHPDKEKIVEFISACGKEGVFLPFERLTDTGSILFIK